MTQNLGRGGKVFFPHLGKMVIFFIIITVNVIISSPAQSNQPTCLLTLILLGFLSSLFHFSFWFVPFSFSLFLMQEEMASSDVPIVQRRVGIPSSRGKKSLKEVTIREDNDLGP